jgi:hypothetical protein
VTTRDLTATILAATAEIQAAAQDRAATTARAEQDASQRYQR